MGNPADDLTDKEKEALRLLLAGHDTKSSAAQLDLSVHTINDRLRNARRKLGVSSSREAARILGDAEGAPPQNPAHTSFGMADTTDETDTADLNINRPTEPFGFTWLAGGMLIMSILIAAAMVSVVYFADDGSAVSSTPTAASSEAAAKETPADPESLGRAERFLKHVDDGDWAGSWKAAGAFFQSEVTADEWSEKVEPVREPLGAVKERTLSNVQRASTLPGAPEGEYEVLQFQTDFAAEEALLVETVVMLQGADGWEVVGYFVTPGTL